MAILWKHKPDGGFLCGDTDRRIAVYAYPTSVHAKSGARRPRATAEAMLDGKFRSSPEEEEEAGAQVCADINRRQDAWLDELSRHQF